MLDFTRTCLDFLFFKKLIFKGLESKNRNTLWLIGDKWISQAWKQGKESEYIEKKKGEWEWEKDW
jgi:hypothetical protein